MLMDLLTWIENSSIAIWVRESVSIFAFPGILSLHTFGLAFVVGISTGINLRVLGFAKEIPIAPLRKFMPALWAGFWVNAISGALLLAANATTTTFNPIFIIKLVAVALAVANVFALNRSLFDRPGHPAPLEPSTRARRLALSGLALWSIAIVTGRMTAYLDLVKNFIVG